MAINKFRQKRDFQFEDLTEEENLSFTVEGCGLKEMVPKKRRRTIHGKEINQVKDLK